MYSVIDKNDTPDNRHQSSDWIPSESLGKRFSPIYLLLRCPKLKYENDVLSANVLSSILAGVGSEILNNDF